MPPDEPAVRGDATRRLPQNPSLNLLSNIAKKLRKAHKSRDPSVYQRIRSHHPAHSAVPVSSIGDVKFSLRDAQLVVAREHGFDNWADMKREIESSRQVDDGTNSVPLDIDQLVPLFAVSDMTESLSHYVDDLGFRISKEWIDDGKLAWCWIERDAVALMLQQYRTEGRNARVFQGRRGVGCQLACLPPGDLSSWPHHGHLTETVDPDGYTLLSTDGAFAATDATFSSVVLVLDVVNITESVRFYIDGLGFRETDRWASGGITTRCRLSSGSVSILLNALPEAQRRSLGQTSQLGQGINITMMCEDAIAQYRAISRRGIAAREPFVGNRLWNVDVSDPDGYRMTFSSPSDHSEETTYSEVEGR